MIQLDTSIKSAARCLYSCVVFFPTLILGLVALGLPPHTPKDEQAKLCLLAGTPTNYGDEGFPATLYSVGGNAKLKVLREVVSQKDGLYSVHQAADALFLAYPHITPITVSVVHVDDPLRQDEVLFNPQGLTSIQNREGLAERFPSGADELFPLALSSTGGKLIAVSNVQAPDAQRAATDRWGEYANLRVEGTPGGPSLATGPFGTVVGGSVKMTVFGHSMDVEEVPAVARDIKAGSIAWLMVMSKEYSVLALAEPASHDRRKSAGSDDVMFAHLRAKDQWKKITIEGSRSRLRIFGPWLAIIVGFENAEHKPGPGRQNERGSGNNRLPNLQVEYQNLVGRDSWLPGILTLQNLADGRKIRLETGQEDSEILRVDGDVLLYRINDAIYQARIVGDQLKDSTMIVKDEDVPEIHWAFWSK